MIPDLSEQAAFLRAALWLGLLRGAEVVAWAEAQLIAAPDAPAALVEVAVVDPDDVTGLRHALLRLGPERPPATVVDAVVALAGRQFAYGDRTLADTCTVLTQARQWLPVSREMAEAIRQIELARHHEGQTADDTGVETRVRALVDGVRDADARFAPR